MSSSNRLVPQPFNKNVNLKVLYTFDDRNTFLARSVKPVSARIITLPNQPPHNGTQIGCVDLRKCLTLLQSVSPEWFQKGMDYSIYYKDIIETGEPYVGSGLFTKIIKDAKSNFVITGRLTANFINLYQGNASADTLDIKLRFSPIHSLNHSESNNTSNNKRKQIDSFPIYAENNSSSSPYPNIDESMEQNQQLQPSQPRKRAKKSNTSASQKASNTATSTKGNGPQLACRTQSLPFITEDSLAHRIRISDMIASRVDEEIDASGEPISSRFSNFPKNSKNDDYSQPTRARKSKSFIQSVVKIGDNAVGSKNKKTALASVTVLPSKRCVNCMSTSNPPYKFHKDGIFQIANSGYLCTVCNFYQAKGDTKSLRERGELGARGLLDDPYSRVTTTKRFKKKRAPGSNPNSSNIENSSSPVFSSPMHLQNGFSTKSKKQSLVNSSLTQHSIHETIPEVENFKHEDLMSLLKLESAFANYKSIPTNDQNMQQLRHMHDQSSGELDHLEDMFRIPESKYAVSNIPSSSSSSLKGQSKNNTPNGNSEEYYRDFDNVPIDATKLNTTLIPMDDDDKENYPPPNMPPPNISVYNSNSNNPANTNSNTTHVDDNDSDDGHKGNLHNLFGTHDLSPSIQRIIESFSNEPSSPTRASNTDWNYNFFEETSSQNGTTSGNQHTERDDPEIDRILAQHEKYEITPRDPGTAQSQQNGDSPNRLRMTPGNSAFEMQISSTEKTLNTGSNANSASDKAQAESQNSNETEQANGEQKNFGSVKEQEESVSTKKSRLTMPSSPFFDIHNEDLSKEDKTLDTTESLINWDTKSSPVTEPLSSSYCGKP